MAPQHTTPHPAAAPEPHGSTGPNDLRARRAARLLPLLVGLLATALYCSFSWSQWIRWEVPSWDDAIFTQLLCSYASGHGPVVDLKGHGFNLLGDHFHPLLILLTPLYTLFPSALTLMLAQDVLFGISAAVVTGCAVRALRPGAALAVGLAYALSFGLQNAVSVQFHEIALAVPLLALSLTAWRERRVTAATVWAAPVALVKEDLGVTVAMIGVLMLGRAALPFVRRWWPVARRRLAGFVASYRRPALRCTAAARDATPAPAGGAGGVVVLDRAQWRSDLRTLRRTRELWCGAGLVLWGLLVTALAVGVVLPALNPAGEFAYADKLDLGGFVRDPAAAVVLLVVPAAKLVTWLLLLLAGAVVAVRSPIALVALPTLAWRMLSPNDGYWGPGWHYSAVLMPVVFVALVDALVRLRGDAARARRRAVAGRPGGRASGWDAPVLGRLAAGAPWAALVIALVLGTQQPLAQLATAQAWQPDPRAQAKTAAVERIPRGASVATDLTLMNALVSRTDVQWIGNGEDPAPEYVVVDRAGATWGGAPPTDVADYAREVYGHDYTVVSDEANIAVARKTP